ncbi:unnamed protein product [Bursaphelenchus okinawaensis]|uniref:SEFIR domain-containing protein n=1 Tax=Bursaphelenchus okinawaensis TaxID=465554 RepID=A0A811KS77_9BILA|nr:unnamed protein product [Bursaphelenchus okinawaensis]CAG9112494.1 unnamed protein product [Bursaphelenchus okinawaensis]
MRGNCLMPILLVLFTGFLVISSESFSYTRDCNDQQHREIHCVVRPVDCEEDEQIPQVNKTTLIPDEAHDIRVSNVAKAVSKRKGESYQLSVDISWQTPPNNSTRLLHGFLLEINSEDGKQHQCFLLDVNGSTWTENTVKLSPRLHFFTESLFRFSQNYEISVHSLPEGIEITRTATKTVQMPHHPRSIGQSGLLPSNCSHSSHPFASQWAAGFRRVLVYPLTRTVHIEFIAAPPEYCFEQYEVRLMDPTVMLVERTTLISLDQLVEENTNGTVNYIGYVNFTDVELNKTYTPTVIPVETSLQGRCLCPVNSQNHPKSNNVVCTCVNSESKRIRLIKIDATKTICMGCSNETKPILETELDEDESQTWLYHLGVFLLILFLLCLLAVMILMVYQKYRTWGKAFRIQLIHDRNPSRSPNLEIADLQTNALLKPNGSVLRSTNLNILIVYSHDAPEHDLAVIAFAEYLRDVFNMDVHLDMWDAELIHKNLMDYLSLSVVNADYVVVINSIGTSARYNTKLQSLGAESPTVIQRNEAGPFDKLFLSQVDFALQHGNVISARLNYSHFDQVLPPLQGRLQYVIPDTLGPLLTALHKTNMKNDPRLNGVLPLHDEVSSRLAPQVQRSEESEPLLEMESSANSLHSATDLHQCCEEEHEEPVAQKDYLDDHNGSEDSGNVTQQMVSQEYTDDICADDGALVHNTHIDTPVHNTTFNNDTTVDKETEDDGGNILNPVTEQPLQKWRADPNQDSGMVSDADLQMISSS